MTAGRSSRRQEATRCGSIMPVRVVGAPLFCLAGGGQAGLSALHATGIFFWRPRSDTVRGDRDSRSRLNGRFVKPPSTSANPGNVQPDDLAPQTTRLHKSGMHRFDVGLYLGQGRTTDHTRTSADLTMLTAA